MNAAQLITAALVGCALLLTLAAPRLLCRWTWLRRAPGEALALWQAVSLSGVACALLAAPVGALAADSSRQAFPVLLGLATAVSVVMFARLLWSGHQIGTDLRRMRSRQRQLVELIGSRLEQPDDTTKTSDQVSVVADDGASAFCLPGRRQRIVLSQGAVDALSPDELRAVLAHEHAHLRQRHDLVLELFTVMHEAVPAQIRAPAALDEVHLLAEILADRAAVRSRDTDETTLARSLVSMATAGARAGQVKVRLKALATPAASPLLRAAILLLAAAALLLAPALVIPLALTQAG